MVMLHIDHVELFVPDRYEAAGWYRRVLGLEILSAYEHWATVPGGPLMISSDEGSTRLALFEGPPQESKPTAGFHRVAFRADAGAFIQFVQRLGELGLKDQQDRPITVDSVADHKKAYSVYFSDPYGHRLEVTTYDYESTRAALAGRQLPGATRLDRSADQQALAWQIGVWNGMSEIYLREIDRRFAPVVDAVITRAALSPGERVLDLGTGTGAIAERAADGVGPGGHVVGIDISLEMLALARARVAARGYAHVTLQEGRAEAIPADDRSFDVVLASLSLMYAIDREAAAREIARVLRPNGRLVAAVWAGPDECDIVRFQQTAGSFAGPPPVPGVGPGALADPHVFLQQLAAAGIEARAESEVLGFEIDSFALAWDALARVTTAHLPPELQADAKEAVQAAMYPLGDGPRHFRNVTQFILGRTVARRP